MDTPITYLEAELLTNLTDAPVYIASETTFLSAYHNLAQRGLAHIHPTTGKIDCTVAGERAIDAWWDAEAQARTTPSVRAREFLLAAMVSLGLVLLIVLIAGGGQ
jgi:hypothetical protein